MRRGLALRLRSALCAGARLLGCVLLVTHAHPAAGFTTPFASQGLFSAEVGHPSLELASLYSSSAGEQKTTGPEISTEWRFRNALAIDATAPFVYEERAAHPAHYGYGSSEIAVVYRLLHGSNGGLPSVGIAPELDLPAAAAGHHIGSTHWAGYLPLIVTESAGPWTVYANVARDLNPGPSSRDYWFYGAVLTRRITHTLSLGAEVFRQGASSPGARPTDGFNFGGQFELTSSQSLYFSAGRGLRYANATDRLMLFFGYQRLL